MVSLQTVPLETSKNALTVKLCAEIEECLRASCIVQLRGLVCESHGLVIVLRGQVDSYYYKQLAQELVKKLDRHVTIVNLVTVS